MNQQTPPAIPPSQPQQEAPTSGLAIASLVCGLLGFIMSFFTGIPAIIMGHMAMSRIKAANGAIGGRGIALAGTILGYVTTFLIIIIGVLAGIATPLILRAQKAGERVELKAGISMVATDFENHYTKNGRYPSATEFSAVIELPPVKTGWDGGWTYLAETPADADLPLLISPQKDEKAIILWADMNVTEETSQRVSQMISESKFEVTIIQFHE